MNTTEFRKPNSVSWLLVFYHNKDIKVIAAGYNEIIRFSEFVQQNHKIYSHEDISNILDNLECLHYGMCTLMGIDAQNQIKFKE